jgi:hypothetical protein
MEVFLVGEFAVEGLLREWREVEFFDSVLKGFGWGRVRFWGFVLGRAWE